MRAFLSKLWIILPLGAGLAPHAPATVGFPYDEEVVVQRAAGTFTVRLSPLAPYNDEREAALGRLSIDKGFSGDLVATGKGEMLTAMTEVDGSAAYVAIERVSGTLHGRTGTFALQHTGIMDRGAPQLTVTVVPDSGTGELVGLSGTMAITIMDGKHFYEFEYTLGEIS
jgi:hypothetical protein